MIEYTPPGLVTRFASAKTCASLSVKCLSAATPSPPWRCLSAVASSVFGVNGVAMTSGTRSPMARLSHT
jgi:hypothetical protein